MGVEGDRQCVGVKAPTPSLIAGWAWSGNLLSINRDLDDYWAEGLAPC